MILLDATIVYEMIKPTGDANARRWMDSYAELDFFIATPIIAELRFGLALLPDGRKKEALTTACDTLEDEIFAGRILPFDQRAAHAFARLRAKRRMLGKPLNVMDALVASIASAHAMTLATRNVANFVDLDLALINPFALP